MNSSKIPLLLVVATLSSASGIRAQSVVLREEFESGAPGWTFQGLAHIEPDASPCGALAAPFPSPSHSVWFGAPATCDYDSPLGGGLLDPPNPIQLPVQAPHLILRYRRFQATEHCVDGYDVSWLEVKTAGGLYQLLYAGDCSTEPGWTDLRADLSPWAGLLVDVHMGFATGDNMYNDTLGWWLDDFEIVSEPGAVMCTATSTCPCPQGSFLPPNYVNAGGCKNSLGVQTRLFGNGVESVGSDTVELVTHGLPHLTSLIWVQGLTSGSGTFGDGLRCVGGTLVRLAVRSVTGGADTYPHAGEIGVAQKGSLPVAGGTRTYQVVYRDAASFCTSSTFNASNGYAIAWRP